jgi:hypothetical protein
MNVKKHPDGGGVWCSFNTHPTLVVNTIFSNRVERHRPLGTARIRPLLRCLVFLIGSLGWCRSS